jgi:uncharacterized radical SAM superfamily protein
MMLLPYNIQYLTNESGMKTAVQIPFNQWNDLINEYSRLKELLTLKNDLKLGFSDLMEVEKGKSKEVTLSDFLNED